MLLLGSSRCSEPRLQMTKEVKGEAATAEGLSQVISTQKGHRLSPTKIQRLARKKTMTMCFLWSCYQSDSVVSYVVLGPFFFLGCGETLLPIKIYVFLVLIFGCGPFSRLNQIKSDVQPAAAMAQKTLQISSANGDQKRVSVTDTTTVTFVLLKDLLFGPYKAFYIVFKLASQGFFVLALQGLLYSHSFLGFLSKSKVREILQQCHRDDGQDRQANLLRGVMLLEPDMTVNQAGLEDGDEISLFWSEPFVEMASCRGVTIDQALSIRIPRHVTRIDEMAFCKCKALIKVFIQNSVTSIGDEAFFGCISLTYVDIPNSVTRIGDKAFRCCSSLTQVEIPNSVTSIGHRAFSGCSSLTQVEIPNSVTSIGIAAFFGCSSLIQVEIPNSVTSIGEDAFSGCSSLTRVEIPNSVTSIGDGAFSRCSSLTRVQVPNSVTSIGDYAFCGCSSLTQVEIPNSVTRIGVWAFKNCPNHPNFDQ